MVNHPPEKFPSLRQLEKGPEVEDPVNRYVHRPLAYLFARAVSRTSMSPNQVTLFAVLVGATAGIAFLIGSPEAMVFGGIALWISAILDGADGILARAKGTASPHGRAIDGLADAIVAVLTVFPAFYHIWEKHQDPFLVALMLPAVISANLHMSVYDYYKESFRHHTDLVRGGEGEEPAVVSARQRASKEHGFLVWLAMTVILDPYTRTQFRIIDRLDPGASREGIRLHPTEQSAAIYREENRLTMRLFTILSTAPHAYLMAIAAIFDRLDLYLYARVFLMNGILALAVVLQRRATRRTNERLASLGVIERVDSRSLSLAV